MNTTPSDGTANNTKLLYNDTIGSDDATWILTSAFIIFTMQSGFGLLESGMVSRKNEANIMVKNAVDVIYGGLAYWLFGFALSFGTKERNNPFCGLGYFFTDAGEHEMGSVYAKYFFQLSFSTTATTIVSGAMAERANLKAYTIFSFVNTVTYCFPAHWIWDNEGWLHKLGAVDIAGGSAVHLVGGISGLVATIMLKPRYGKFDPRSPPKHMASPTNVLLGTFMLWWGWLGFNCGSTFGISGAKWKLASRSAVVTINGSIGGGVLGMCYSYLLCKNKLNIHVFVTGILGGLVSITERVWYRHSVLLSQYVLVSLVIVIAIALTIPILALSIVILSFTKPHRQKAEVCVVGTIPSTMWVLTNLTLVRLAICSVARPWEALIIGMIGALIACSGCSLLERLKIDDPVGCVPTHAFAGIWGLIAVGLFAEKDTLEQRYSLMYGVLKGGPWKFLGVQLLLIVSVATWGAITTYLELKIINHIIPLRVSLRQEILGADSEEHGIKDEFSYLNEEQLKRKVGTNGDTSVLSGRVRVGITRTGSSTDGSDVTNLDSSTHRKRKLAKGMKNLHHRKRRKSVNFQTETLSSPVPNCQNSKGGPFLLSYDNNAVLGNDSCDMTNGDFKKARDINSNNQR